MHANAPFRSNIALTIGGNLRELCSVLLVVIPGMAIRSRCGVVTALAPRLLDEIRDLINFTF